MSSFRVSELPLSGLKLIERHPFEDHRGLFTRLFCAEALAEAGWYTPVAQVNFSRTTTAGVIRGMHFQRPPHSEVKLVSCIAGEVWDVVVDLRIGSDTYLCWHAEYLSADNGGAMLIPEGFAHGFQTVTDNVELIYCHSEQYTPASEGRLNPHDPTLNIEWPLPVTDISDKDAQQPLLDKSFIGIKV